MTKRSFQYANYKTQATSFMDIALLVANVSQLRFLIEMPEFNPRVILALMLVSLSIILQTGVGIVLINNCKDEQKKIQGKWRQNSETGRDRRSITPPTDYASPAEAEKVPQDEMDAVSTSSSDSEERIDMHETINITEHDDLDEPDAGHNVIMTQDGATYTATADEPDNEERLSAVDHVDGPDEEMGVVVIVNEPCFDEFCERKTGENFWVRNGIFIIMVVNIILGGLELSASKDVIFQSMMNRTHA